MKDLIISTREYREKLLTDSYRPTYHFAIPDDNGHPGDPNGVFFVDGLYHVMYLYKNSKTNGFHWGHISSVDLLHWRHHPDALEVLDEDGGCYSGGVFIDDDKTAYITFWKFPSKDYKSDNGGIALACSKPPYEKWERMETLAIESSKEIWGSADIKINDKTVHIGCADPSNIWKRDGIYYMQTGNHRVLINFGLKDNDPNYQGDWTELFRSTDLKKWEYVGRFYENTHKDEDWPDKTEDDMCPCILPLYDAKENGKQTDKHLQLFISHNKGCQYYIGTLEKEGFLPIKHGRMTWKDNTVYAPEALIDDKKRHIMWAWIRDNIDGDFDKFGWTGVFSFPRALWYSDDTLYMAPVDELDNLQYNEQSLQISDDNHIAINNGELFRIKMSFNTQNQSKTGISLRISPDKKYHTDIYYDKEKNALVFDASKSGEMGKNIIEEAPFTLRKNENLDLDVFVDKSVVEVYANSRQAICRRIYPENPSLATGVELIGKKGNVLTVKAWDMAPANPY